MATRCHLGYYSCSYGLACQLVSPVCFAMSVFFDSECNAIALVELERPLSVATVMRRCATRVSVFVAFS